MSERVELILDDEVLAAFRETAQQTGRSLEETVNDVLRSFVKDRTKDAPPKPFEVRAKAMYARPGLNFDDIEELLDQVEGPLRR